MKRHVKKMIVMVLSIVLTVSATCTGAYAQSTASAFSEDPFELPRAIEYPSQDCSNSYGFTTSSLRFTVLKDNTKVRSGASENSETLYVLNAGDEIIVTGATVNSHDNTWFILEDGGYVYCRNVSFNIKENTVNEYKLLQELRKYSEDPEKVFYSQAALLVALFTGEGNQFFNNMLCSYTYNADYMIITDRSCITVSPESMRYIYYGYLASRLGFTKRETMLVISNAEAVKRVYDNANESFYDLMLDTVADVVSSKMSEWLNIAYNTISVFRDLMNVSDDMGFVDSCKELLCVSDNNKELISIGYELGVNDRE